MSKTLNENSYPRTVCGLIFDAAELFFGKAALRKKNASGEFVSITYSELADQVERLGMGFISRGVEPGTRVALISENRYEWMICDLALLSVGAVDVPRSSQCSKSEIEYIVEHSGSEIVVAENDRVLEAVLPDSAALPRVRAVFTIEKSSRAGVESIWDIGGSAPQNCRDEFKKRLVGTLPESMATIIYTSGTTARPKGVVLSHANIVHNMRTLPGWVGVGSEDTYLSILPSWHAFERTVEYTALSCGATVAYSKPIPGMMLSDMRKAKPTVIVAVPRIWQAFRDAIRKTAANAPLVRRSLFRAGIKFGEFHSRVIRIAKDLNPRFAPQQRSRNLLWPVLLALLKPAQIVFDLLVYRKIRNAAGGRLRLAISGGGALSKGVEEFFSACSFPLVEGYGLTEAAPIVACRRFMKDASFTVGMAVPETDIRIVDDEGRVLGPGEAGEVLVRGPQVMLGYHRLENETRLVLDPAGWLHTGDLGMLTIKGELAITGRRKDTIVLTSGENVEPEALEEALKESKYIDHVVLVGNDREVLGALVVPNMDVFNEELAELGEQMARDQRDEFAQVKRVVADEIRRLVSEAHGFKRHERIGPFELLRDEFEVDRELTMTQKVKRNYIINKFSKLIDDMYTKRKEKSGSDRNQ